MINDSFSLPLNHCLLHLIFLLMSARKTTPPCWGLAIIPLVFSHSKVRTTAGVACVRICFFRIATPHPRHPSLPKPILTRGWAKVWEDGLGVERIGRKSRNWAPGTLSRVLPHFQPSLHFPPSTLDTFYQEATRAHPSLLPPPPAVPPSVARPPGCPQGCQGAAPLPGSWTPGLSDSSMTRSSRPSKLRPTV